jgi:hypothetical protein
MEIRRGVGRWIGVPRHCGSWDADVWTCARDGLAGCGEGEGVVYEGAVGRPGDGDKGAWEEGDEETRCDQEGAERREGRV